MLPSGAHQQLTLTVLDINGKKLDFDHLSAVLHIRNDPASVRKFPGVALADLGDTEGFDKDGEELYGFQLSDGVYKRKKVPQEGSLKFEELSNVDFAYDVPKRHHMLAFAGGKVVSLCGPRPTNGMAY